MRKVFVLVAAIAIMVSCTQQKKNYTVNIELDGLANGKVFIQKREKGETIKIDSTEAVDGKLTFTCSIDQPSYVALTMENGGRKYLPFFIENADITIKGHIDSLKKAVITGSKVQDELKAYIDGQSDFQKKKEDLYKEYMSARQTGDTAKMAEVEGKFDGIIEEAKKYSIAYVKTNTKSIIAPFVISTELIRVLEAKELDELLKGIDVSLATNSFYVETREQVDKKLKVAVGEPIVDFSLDTPEGKKLAVSEVAKGTKVLLIDFWASWCSPCRAENPNVVAIYKDFHDKGFDVLGVSLDNDREKWLEAIEKDGLTWNHISDIKGWQCEGAAHYAVRSIPHTVLVVDGKIVAKNVRGEELRAKVAELLN